MQPENWKRGGKVQEGMGAKEESNLEKGEVLASFPVRIFIKLRKSSEDKV